MQKIMIFGAGNCGRLIASKLIEQGAKVLCFLDNDPQKEGKQISLSGVGDTYLYP